MSESLAALAARVVAVRQRVAEACTRAGRDPAEVTLVAVTKTLPAATVRAAYAVGLRDFGENYAQELRDKALQLADLAELRWHFIGPLQRNKAQHVVGTAALIHTVASTALIERLAALAAQRGTAQGVLLQLNLSGEGTKSGARAEELPALLAALGAHPQQLHGIGLMTMPPQSADPQQTAPIFAALRQLRDTFADHWAADPAAAAARLGALSMGMSADYAVAIAEGATLVRVGSAIFGQRAP
ncbi:MAG: YggS family pyridoxal phosphate-dependent enzyme [Proteobacteria bacterium]|nr:YggS family pyridoxal phosphate-dependent enzyme [Pseudomonadota bacterium]